MTPQEYRHLQIQNAIKRLLQMKAEVFDCERLGDRVVHNSTDYEEVLHMLREALNPIGRIE